VTLTIKNVPAEVYRQSKLRASENGRSLNAEVIAVLTAAVKELDRRRRMRSSREKLERFFATLPQMFEQRAFDQE
jgi:plasmid stability protein